MQIVGGTAAPVDVLGIGNAIVDIVAHAEETLLRELDLDKGIMTLVDETRSAFLYNRMGPGIEMSGGSCANTISGIASLGGNAAYIGRVKDDDLGQVFGHDIRASGVRFRTPASKDGPPTARCLVFVTPDAQRTMATYLGACVELDEDDIDADLVSGAGITYLEGYLWDRPEAKAACQKAARIARGNGRQVAMTLSDPFCVERWRDEFVELVDSHVDILFANEAEITGLYGVRDFDTALQAVRGRVDLAALTRSAKGSVIVAGDEIHIVDAAPVPRVVDTTGAGDLYAAGFLRGLSLGLPLAACARLGGRAAAEIIQHFGARPERPMAPLVDAVR